jgi:TolB-like protein/Tfp pilus assembly protein PilF
MDALLVALVPERSAWRKRLMLATALTALAALAIVARVGWDRKGANHARLQSIAVLPLENLTGDASSKDFVDRLSDALTQSLAQVSTANVISRDSASRYKGTRKAVAEIARELGVDGLVRGSVKRVGSRLRIDAQLVDAASGRQLWAKPYEGEERDSIVLQADIATELVGEIESQISPERKARLARLRSVKPEVYEASLKGRFFLNRRNEADIRKGISYFEQALHDDPEYAPAYVGLADGYRLLAIPASVISPREASRLATPMILKALSLDPNLAEAHFELGAIKSLEWDWRGAGEEFRRALELNPNHANAHVAYSLHLVDVGRLDEALVEAKRAQRLDPLTAVMQVGTAQWFTAAGRYNEAIQEYRKLLELDPNYGPGYYHMANAYHDAGMYHEALLADQKAFDISKNPAHRAEIAHQLAHLGKIAEAEEILEQLKPVLKDTWPFFVARPYAVLRRKEQTLQWLEYGYEVRSLGLNRLNRSRDFDWLRSDPRFQDLVRRIGWEQ